MIALTALRPHSWRTLFPTSIAAPETTDWIAPPAADRDDNGELWRRLAKASDAKLEKPRARADVEIERLGEDKGAILSHAEHGIYFHIASDDLYLWERMDGARSQIDLVVDYFMRFKALAPERVAALVEQLRANGLLTEPADEVYPKLEQRLRRATPLGILDAITQTVVQREIAIGGIDGRLDRLYRAGVWVAFTRPAQLAFWAIALMGSAAFAVLATSGRFSILGEGSILQGALTLFVFQVFALLLHESAHAFTVKKYGRRVRRAGLFILLGLVGAFVDTSDIWPAGKRAQLAVTWAGPFMNAILGGFAALAIALNPDADFAPLAFQFAVSQYALVAFNLTPFIRLDGYYLLSDWLELPNLRQRAIRFLSSGLPARMRETWAQGRLIPKLDREEKILALFGILSAVWIVNLLGAAVIAAPVRISIILEQLLGGNFAGVSPFTIFLLLAGLILTLFFFFRALVGVRALTTLLARSLAEAPAARVALVLAAFAVLIALVPDIVAAAANTRVAEFYAQVVSVSAGGLAAIYGWRLTKELRGTRLYIVMLGFLVGAVGLTLVGLFAADAVPSPWRFIALVPLAAAMGLRAGLLVRLASGPLRWTVLTMLVAVVGNATASVPYANGNVAANGNAAASVPYLPAMLGYTLLAAAALMYWQLAHRPLVARRIGGDIQSDDPAQLLARAFAAVAAEMLRNFDDIAGRTAMLKLVADFNARMAAAEAPVWLDMRGQVGSPAAAEGAPVYRAALAELRQQIAATLGGPFAQDAQTTAIAELPDAAQMAFDRWVLDKEPAALHDERVHLRVAGRRLAETLAVGCARVYGWKLLEEPIAAFNRHAATSGWTLYLRGNGRLSEELAGDQMQIADTYSRALRDLIARVAAIAGVAFVERGIVQVYDGLPWEAREMTRDLLFARLPYAGRAIRAKSADTRAEVLRGVPSLAWRIGK
ncbi:MAG: hypothetical protein HY782_17360 [Chloroflexi bacterium]|nr:hypothetical protein [Chloroflexota bacterium]